MALLETFHQIAIILTRRISTHAEAAPGGVHRVHTSRHTRRDAQSVYLVVSAGCTTSSGSVLPWSTRSVTLPSIQRWMPLRP